MNLFSSALLYGVAFPFASSAISSSLSKAAFGFSDVLSAAASIYWLDGVLWEGPKVALAQMVDRPADALQLATGVILYLTIVTKIKSAALDTISNAELQAAASVRLSLGDLDGAEALIDKVSIDNADTWNLRIIQCMIKGEVGKAESLCSSKMPELGHYGTRLEMAVLVYLVLITLSWKTPEESQLQLWDKIVAAKPSEEELAVLFFLVFPVIGTRFYSYSIPAIMAVAQDGDFFHLRLLVAMATQDAEPIPGLIERAKEASSISPAVRVLTEAGLMNIHKVEAPESFETLLSTWLQSLGSMNAHVQRLSGLFLASLSLLWVSRLDPTPGGAVADWVAGQNEVLKEKLLAYPHGQALLVSFREFQERATS